MSTLSLTSGRFGHPPIVPEQRRARARYLTTRREPTLITQLAEQREDEQIREALRRAGLG